MKNNTIENNGFLFSNDSNISGLNEIFFGLRINSIIVNKVSLNIFFIVLTCVKKVGII